MSIGTIARVDKAVELVKKIIKMAEAGKSSALVFSKNNNQQQTESPAYLAARALDPSDASSEAEVVRVFSRHAAGGREEFDRILAMRAGDDAQRDASGAGGEGVFEWPIVRAADAVETQEGDDSLFEAVVFLVQQ